MSDADQVLAGHARSGEQSLDPFDYYRGVASRIAGLGGNAPGHDPSYAFHTPYVPVSRGPAHFTVRFDGLRARRGTIVLRIHMLPDEPGAAARLVNSERIQLNRLVQLGGGTRIDFEGFRGFSFAVMGQVPDDSDASAAGMTITLDRPVADAAANDAPADDIRGTRFAGRGLRPVAQLLSVTEPTLAAPVSQSCTRRQLREPVWRDFCSELGYPTVADPARWPCVYGLAVLCTYGFAAAGARGLLLTEEDEVAAALRARGCEVRRSPDDPEPRGGTSLDFLYSDRGLHRRGEAADIAIGIEASLAQVRPGGLVLHLLRLDVGQGTSADALRRAEIERLALVLISRGHEVAQLAIGGTALVDEDGVRAFGLIVRRAPSPL